MNRKTRFIAQGAMIAALYTALTYGQNLILPDSASWMIQYRASEALCVLALFTPAAIPGLTLGCLLFNLSYAGALPLDPIMGTLASFLSAEAIYLTRKIRLGGIPLPGLMAPALFNGLLVGWELEIYLGGGFLINAFYVALGELLVMLTLGLLLFYTLKRKNLGERLFS